MNRSALDFHRSLPGYRPTPLVDCPSLAERLGIRAVWVKDESARFGLPSFKILGASWAVYREICARVGVPHEPLVPLPTLKKHLRADRPLTLVAATDGNHGRAVARMARLLALDAHILVPNDMSSARIDSIEGEGARVTLVEGTYDDAVAASAERADGRNLVISDTAWPGYEQVPNWVIEGYSSIVWETFDQLEQSTDSNPDTVAVQIGVGGLAAAIARQFAPIAQIIGVEPLDAACALASIEAGKIVDVPGPHASIMAGLNCGRVSVVAWPTISNTIGTFVAVSDSVAVEAMRLLADAGIVSGESGAAGLAGLLALRDEHGLDTDLRALVISTEGATDPEAYSRVLS